MATFSYLLGICVAMLINYYNTMPCVDVAFHASYLALGCRHVEVTDKLSKLTNESKRDEIVKPLLDESNITNEEHLGGKDDCRDSLLRFPLLCYPFSFNHH